MTNYYRRIKNKFIVVKEFTLKENNFEMQSSQDPRILITSTQYFSHKN